MMHVSLTPKMPPLFSFSEQAAQAHLATLSADGLKCFSRSQDYRQPRRGPQRGLGSEGS